MSLTLTILDAADGTGGTAALAGSDPATLNTVYRAQLLGAEGPLAWQSAGSRSGDGAVAVGGPLRNYWLWYATGTVGGAPAVSQVVLQSLTDATALSVRERAVSAVADRLRLLDLEDIPADRVYVRATADDPVTTVPGVVVIRDVTPDAYLGGTNARDDIGYPVQVVFQDENRMGAGAPIGKWDRWAQAASRAFRYQRLPGVRECQYCTIEAAKAAVGADGTLAKVYQKVVTALTVRVVCREVRGIGV